MVFSNSAAAPKTRKAHFTEPVRTEQTAYGSKRWVHRVPLEWFLVFFGEIDTWDYEHYLEHRELFDDTARNHTLKSTRFDYGRQQNPDGTGKPYEMTLLTAKGEVARYYSRTHYLLWLLDYNEDTYEVVAISSSNDRDAVLVTIQDQLPHLPN